MISMHGSISSPLTPPRKLGPLRLLACIHERNWEGALTCLNDPVREENGVTALMLAVKMAAKGEKSKLKWPKCCETYSHMVFGRDQQLT